MPPKKDVKCYNRTAKSGATYTTCKDKKTGKQLRKGERPSASPPKPKAKPKAKTPLKLQPAKVEQKEKKVKLQTAKIQIAKPPPEKKQPDIQRITGMKKKELENPKKLMEITRKLPMELREKILGKDKQNIALFKQNIQRKYDEVFEGRFILKEYITDSVVNLYASGKLGSGGVYKYKNSGSMKRDVMSYVNIVNDLYGAFIVNMNRLFGKETADELLEGWNNTQGVEYIRTIDEDSSWVGSVYDKELGKSSIIKKVVEIGENRLSDKILNEIEPKEFIYILVIGKMNNALKERMIKKYDELMNELLNQSSKLFFTKGNVSIAEPKAKGELKAQKQAEAKAKADAKAKAKSIVKGSNTSNFDELFKDAKDLDDVSFKKKYGLAKRTMTTAHINKVMKILGMKTKWKRNSLTKKSVDFVRKSYIEKRQKQVGANYKEYNNDAILTKKFNDAYWSIVKKATGK